MIITLILSAFALSFAYAPFGARFLAYFSLIPLLLLIHKYSYKKVFWYGLIFGGAFALFHLWWLYFLIVPVEPVTKILLYLGVTVLFFYLGLYAAVFSIATKFLGIIFAPLVWAVLEFIRTKSEIGFPWGFLGYTQTPYIPIIQLSSIFGVYGLSAWVIWINLVILWIFQKKHKLTYLIILIISFFFPIGFGLIRTNVGVTAQSQLKVAIVQPNVGPNEKGDYESRTRLTNELIALINKAREQKPDLIILPETATLVDITRNTELQEKLQSIVDSNNVYLFTGTPLYKPGSPIYYNGAVMFEPRPAFFDSTTFLDTSYNKQGQRKTTETTENTEKREESFHSVNSVPSVVKEVIPKSFDKIYRKIHLVPFSERIPYADKIPLFRKIETGDMGDCTPGKEYTIFKFQIPNLSFNFNHTINTRLTQDFSFSGDNLVKSRGFPYSKFQINFACLICFESILPDLARGFTKRGADMLVNITNDGWFGKTPGPHQHCELAVLRSVENGVPLVRCANNGISLIADPFGRTKSRTKLFTQTVVIDSVASPLHPTFYRRYGDIFIYFAMVLIVIRIIIKPIKRFFIR